MVLWLARKLWSVLFSSGSTSEMWRCRAHASQCVGWGGLSCWTGDGGHRPGLFLTIPFLDRQPPAFEGSGVLTIAKKKDWKKIKNEMSCEWAGGRVCVRAGGQNILLVQ